MGVRIFPRWAQETPQGRGERTLEGGSSGLQRCPDINASNRNSDLRGELAWAGSSGLSFRPAEFALAPRRRLCSPGLPREATRPVQYTHNQ